MSGEEEPRAWEYRDRALIVLPGVSWEEWTSLWQTVEAQHKNINWWVGDCLLAGSREFGERFSQVVDPQYIHQQKGPLWVSSCIPPAERRVGLSWSAHRETAALDADERAEILDLAEANGWGSREIADEIRRRRETHRHNQGPPLDGEPGSTWNEPPPADPPPMAPMPERGDWEPVHEGEATGATDIPPDPVPAAHGPRPATAEDIRNCIAAIRRLAPDVAAGYSAGYDIAKVESTILAVFDLPIEPPYRLRDTDRALALRPPGYRVKVEELDDGNWSVVLRRGDHIGVGFGPLCAMACVEAALSAVLSDMGAC